MLKGIKAIESPHTLRKWSFTSLASFHSSAWLGTGPSFAWATPYKPLYLLVKGQPLWSPESPYLFYPWRSFFWRKLQSRLFWDKRKTRKYCSISLNSYVLLNFPEQKHGQDRINTFPPPFSSFNVDFKCWRFIRHYMIRGEHCWCKNFHDQICNSWSISSDHDCGKENVNSRALFCHAINILNSHANFQ